jgi:hypothetical protein
MINAIKSKPHNNPLKFHSLRSGLQIAAVCALLLIGVQGHSQTSKVGSAPGSKIEIGLVKYKGGGDWYSADRALRNLIAYIRSNTNIDLAPEPVAVEPSSQQLFSHPVIFINGHGNISFSADDVANLRAYFAAGGFLFANDDYGMDQSFRREMKKVLPDAEFMELPFSHPIYHVLYQFPNGCPKIH